MAGRTQGLRFTVVGPGRVGRALVLALAAAGLQPAGVIGRDPAHGSRAVRDLGLDAGTVATDWAAAAVHSDVVFIAVPDRAVGEVAGRLAAGVDGAAGLPEGRVVLHASGVLGSDVLHPLRLRGYAAGSFHPLRSVSGDGRELRGIVWGVEGDAAAVLTARRIAGLLDGHVLELAPESKPLYHAAACMVANYVMALFALGIEMLGMAGVPGPEARRALGPLLAGAAQGAAARGVPEALTGPIERGDQATVAAHLAALARCGVRDELVALYRLLGRETVHLAAAKGSITSSQAAALLRMLDGDACSRGQAEAEDADSRR